jgi:hypothetical protein
MPTVAGEWMRHEDLERSGGSLLLIGLVTAIGADLLGVVVSLFVLGWTVPWLVVAMVTLGITATVGLGFVASRRRRSFGAGVLAGLLVSVVVVSLLGLLLGEALGN